MKRIKKMLKIVGISMLAILIGLLIAAHLLLAPSSDAQVLAKLSNPYSQVHLEYSRYKNHPIRIVRMQETIDTTKLNLVFVHGSPGSLLDFKAYLTDSLLLRTYNMFAYDRVGYGINEPGKILGSLAEELKVLDVVTSEIPTETTVLAGYSYGGPVVLASPKAYRNKVTFAPAIAADLEPKFWALNLCKWTLTRWAIPNVLRAAAVEKEAHLLDLPRYKSKWNVSPAPVINIQGVDDWIVPYENSERLAKAMDSVKFHQVSYEDTGHEVIWSRFKEIKSVLVKLNLHS
ncbi:alpha/beta hydrolase [Flavobacteriaceae bacterium F08102]|nr:alpha/beta hydrolase [Flavobacteriaceae bacterium F08102]